MYFSHQKKFFFIHNVRTGGSSVEKALAPYLPWYLRSPVLRRAWAGAPSQRPLGWERVFFVRKGHVTAAELQHLVPRRSSPATSSSASSAIPGTGTSPSTTTSSASRGTASII